MQHRIGTLHRLFIIQTTNTQRKRHILNGTEFIQKMVELINKANLAATGGLLMAEAVQMALAPALGRLVAHDRIEAACRTAVSEDRALVDVLAGADADLGKHHLRA